MHMDYVDKFFVIKCWMPENKDKNQNISRSVTHYIPKKPTYTHHFYVLVDWNYSFVTMSNVSTKFRLFFWIFVSNNLWNEPNSLCWIALKIVHKNSMIRSLLNNNQYTPNHRHRERKKNTNTAIHTIKWKNRNNIGVLEGFFYLCCSAVVVRAKRIQWNIF